MRTRVPGQQTLFPLPLLQFVDRPDQRGCEASLPDDLGEFTGDPAIGVAVYLHDDTRTQVRVDNSCDLRDALEHRLATALFQQRVVLKIQPLLGVAVPTIGTGGDLDAQRGIGRMDVAMPLAALGERSFPGKDKRIGGWRGKRFSKHAAPFIVRRRQWL